MGAKKVLMISVAACGLLLMLSTDILSNGVSSRGGNALGDRDDRSAESVQAGQPAVITAAAGGDAPSAEAGAQDSEASGSGVSPGGSAKADVPVDRRVAVEDFLFALGHLFEDGPMPLSYSALNPVGAETKEPDLRLVAELVDGFRAQRKQLELKLSNSADREIQKVIDSGRVTPKPAVRDSKGAMRVPISPRGLGPVVTRYNRAGVYHIPMDMLPETQMVKAEMLSLAHDLGCRLASLARSGGYLGEEDFALLVMDILTMGSGN